MHFTRTRLAPSPTGALHLGHARTFLITWWLARQTGAQIIMRMEDLDAGRRKAESIQQAYDDLHWLGMNWDLGPGATSAAGNADVPSTVANALGSAPESFVQSNRTPIYTAAIQELFARRAIYPCTCTRKEIAEAVAAGASAPHEGEETPRYPGTCRGNLGQTLEDAARAAGRPACWRLNVDTGPVTFTDAIAGPQTFDVASDAGDFPLTRFDATPAYQLAVVCDDHDMNIDMVIRGDDLLASTPRQLLIYRTLGWTPPAFAHVPLVIGQDGKRLAKRHGESRIAQFRETRVSPEKIVGWVAWRSGQIAAPREISAADLLPRFDIARLPQARIVIGPADLTWLTG